MEAFNPVIKSIETFIRTNGDRFKLYYIKYDVKGEMLPFRKITQIEQEYGSISNYVHYFIGTYKPESIEVITKKPNGSSHGIHPQSKIFELKPMESINHFSTSSLSVEGLSGVEKIHSLETTLLNRELQKETNRAERYENLYHELRDRHFELEKDHKLLMSKTELEREKERLQNENSLSSVIKEVKPELFGLLGTMMQAKAEISHQGSTLQGLENEKMTLLTDTVSQLPEEMKNEAIEVLIRYLNTDPSHRGKVLQLLRSQTKELNQQITEIINPEKC